MQVSFFVLKSSLKKNADRGRTDIRRSQLYWFRKRDRKWTTRVFSQVLKVTREVAGELVG